MRNCLAHADLLMADPEDAPRALTGQRLQLHCLAMPDQICSFVDDMSACVANHRTELLRLAQELTDALPEEVEEIGFANGRLNTRIEAARAGNLEIQCSDETRAELRENDIWRRETYAAFDYCEGFNAVMQVNNLFMLRRMIANNERRREAAQ